MRYLPVSPSNSIPSAAWFWDGVEENPLDLSRAFADGAKLHVPRSGPNADGVVERVYPRKRLKAIRAVKRWGVWTWETP